MSIEIVHAHVASLLKRVSNDLDLAHRTLMLEHNMQASLNSRPSIFKLKEIIIKALNALDYIENNFTKNGAFAEQIRDIENRSLLIAKIAEELINKDDDNKSSTVQTTIKKHTKVDRASMDSMLENLQNQLKLTSSISFNRIEKPPIEAAPDYLGAAIVILSICIDAIRLRTKYKRISKQP